MTEVWASKHRPKSLKDVVGQDELVAEMMAIVVGDAPMQHYLFYSPEPGTGKTSVAHALANDLGWPIMVFNASSKAERGIEFVEQHIIPVVRSGIKERIIFLDEADQLTDAAQSALKGVIENAHGYFILACNRLPKVSPWLQSRAQVRTFKPVSKTHMETMMMKILAAEQFGPGNLTRQDIDVICRRHPGDLRNAIGAMQALVHMRDEQREKFILSLTTPDLDCNRFLRLCFQDKQALMAALMIEGDVRQSIRSVFEFAVMSPKSTAGSDKMMRIIEASVISERDLIHGVDADVVRFNFARILCGGSV